MDVTTQPSFRLKLASKPINIAIFVFTLIVVFGALVFAVYKLLPVEVDANPPHTWGFGVDWKGILRRGTLAFLTGKSPYLGNDGLIPPWAYLLLSPIALLPKPLGAAFMVVLTYSGYAFALYKLGARLPSLLLFLTSPFIWINALNGNIDWLPVIGFVLPPQIGLFFVLIKPQLGIGIAFFWFIQAWEKGKLPEIIRVFAPVTVAYLISFVAYGFWPLGLSRMTGDPYNASIYPIGIPIAICLLWYAIRQRKITFAMASSPFLAPYVNIHSFAVALFALGLHPLQIAVINALSWILCL